MRTGRTISSCGHGVGGMALAGLTALTTACASGGGAIPLTEAEAEALLADLTGVWALDESSSEVPNWDIQSVGTAIHFEDMEQARQEAVRRSEEEAQRLMAVGRSTQDESSGCGALRGETLSAAHQGSVAEEC